MKCSIPALSLVAFALVACQPKSARSPSATAPEPEVPAAASQAVVPVVATGLTVTAKEPSEHFQEVLRHLDVGGKTLHFQDHSGRREAWIEIVRMIASYAPELDLELADDFDAGAFLDATGVCEAGASGYSVVKDGDLWLSRAYTHYPGGLPELVKLLGEPMPFEGAGILPATTDVAVEGRFDGSLLPAKMTVIAKMFGAGADLDGMLGMDLPIGMTTEGVLRHAKLHFVFGSELGAGQQEELPPLLKHLFLKVTADPELAAAMRVLVKGKLGPAKTIAGRQGWAIPAPPNDLVEISPVVVEDGEHGFILASSEEYLVTVLGEGRKLKEDAAYQSATHHFPEAGNFQGYLSPDLVTAVMGWMEVASAREDSMQPLVSALAEHNPEKPWSLCLALTETGVLNLSELPFAANGKLVSTAAVSMGLTTPVLFVGARSWKKGSDKAACIMNQRNMQQAIRGHQGMNNINEGAPIDWDAIFGEDGYLKKPTCPSGGRYEFGLTYPPSGELAAPCTHKEHQIEDTDGW